jgi:hypothetical protein
VSCTGTCGQITCPRAMGHYCTASGNQGDPCVSSISSCDRC